MWTLEEQQIVWDDMKAGIAPRFTAQKLQAAGFDRSPKDIYACKERLQRWGKVKRTHKTPAKKEKQAVVPVLPPQAGYDFYRFIELPEVIKRPFFPF